MREANPSADRRDARGQRGRVLLHLRVRPYVLQAGGLLAEGVAIAALGYAAMALGLVAATLPEPAFVAAGYMALILLQDGVAAPPRSAKVGTAIRMLALAFVCLAMVAASSRP